MPGMDLRQLEISFRKQTTQAGGVPEHARTGCLPHYFRQVVMAYTQPVAAQIFYAQGRAVFFADGWQLSCVAYQKQLASFALKHVTDKVIQQHTAAKARS